MLTFHNRFHWFDGVSGRQHLRITIGAGPNKMTGINVSKTRDAEGHVTYVAISDDFMPPNNASAHIYVRRTGATEDAAIRTCLDGIRRLLKRGYMPRD